MAEITRNLIVPFIDTAQKATAASTTEATFVPIDLSTTFELGYNAVTDTKSYICYKNDTNTLTGFQPAMDQEIALDNTNPMWKFIEGLRRKMPVGADAKFPVLIASPDTTGTSTAPVFGQLWPDAMVYPDTLNSVDGILTFHIDLNGAPVDGTVSGVGTDTITFTPTTTGGGE